MFYIFIKNNKYFKVCTLFISSKLKIYTKLPISINSISAYGERGYGRINKGPIIVSNGLFIPS